MIRYNYNTQIQPPAPFVHVVLRNPADGTELRNVPAQVDCAADPTVLPREIVTALGLAQIGTIVVGGLGGITYSLPTSAVFVGIHDLTPQPAKVISGVDEPWILLGRDLLNAHRFVLDGPQAVLEID